MVEVDAFCHGASFYSLIAQLYRVSREELMVTAKKPTMVIYWADSKTPLTYHERTFVLDRAELVSLTPQEVLLRDSLSGRKIAVRGVTDAYAPHVPAPKAWA